MLTASLRIQTNPENKKEFESVSHERLVASMVSTATSGNIAER